MGEVRWERDGAVAIITISSPEVRNGLSVAMCGELTTICNLIEADQSLGAAVVRGDNGTFCSGADTRQWDVMSNPANDDAYALTSTIYNSFVRIGQLSVPVVAAVRGAVVGAGLNLMLATDLRVVADDAKIMSGFLKFGIHPGGGFFTLAGRLAGRETAAALGLFGEVVNGHDAVSRGLAWESLPDELVERRALELAHSAAKDPEMIRHAVASLRTELGPPSVSWPAALEMERGVQMWSQRRNYINRQERES